MASDEQPFSGYGTGRFIGLLVDSCFEPCSSARFAGGISGWCTDSSDLNGTYTFLFFGGARRLSKQSFISSVQYSGCSTSPNQSLYGHADLPP